MTKFGSIVGWNLFLGSAFVAEVADAFVLVAAEREGLAEDMESDSAVVELAVGETDRELAVAGSNLLLAAADRTMISVAGFGMDFDTALEPVAVEHGILVEFAEACIHPFAAPGPYNSSPYLLLSLVLAPWECLDTC